MTNEDYKRWYYPIIVAIFSLIIPNIDLIERCIAFFLGISFGIFLKYKYHNGVFVIRERDTERVDWIFTILMACLIGLIIANYF